MMGDQQLQRYIARFTTKTVAMMANRSFFSAGGNIMELALV